MSITGIAGLDHGIHTTNGWIKEVMEAFGTQDRQFAYRVLRAWMHTVRDRLTVEVAAHLAAQMPELLRGVYYDGWSPSHVPHKYTAREFIARFAQDAGIAKDDVSKAAAIVTEVVIDKVAPGAVAQAFGQLPEEVRRLLQPGGPADTP